MASAKNVLLILIGKRKDAAVSVQKTLTAWGCLVKTRLGIHDGVMDDCSEKGLIFCELVGKRDDHIELARKLNLIKGVHAEMVELKVTE